MVLIILVYFWNFRSFTSCNINIYYKRIVFKYFNQAYVLRTVFKIMDYELKKIYKFLFRFYTILFMKIAVKIMRLQKWQLITSRYYVCK